MAGKNAVSTDVILKEFQRDNGRFADLFNGALFEGERVLNPCGLREVDTDVSSAVRFGSHAETVGRLYDVVKKHAWGTDFVLYSLEDQMNVHYAMPLWHMVGDALVYLKERTQLSGRNRKENRLKVSRGAGTQGTGSGRRRDQYVQCARESD